MESDRFDRLARLLGHGVNRRAAVAALAALATGGVGEATAKHKHKRHLRAAGGKPPAGPGGNSACDVFCHTVFGNTRAAGQCTSDAAHGIGLCVLCKADSANLCGTTCCQSPDTCGGNPDKPGVCGHCTPKTCAEQGFNCGTAADGCGSPLDCGQTCPSGQTCGGGGTANVCACIPNQTIIPRDQAVACCGGSCCGEDRSGQPVPTGQCMCDTGCG
ncbi:MAG: hypothetical protein ACJ8H8_05315 [Geminicoccaceae bacterium]